MGFDDKCATVYACAAAYAQTTALCHAGHWRRQSDGGRVQVTNSPLARFLRRPNPYQSRSDFILNQVQSLMYHGNSYAVSYRDERGDIVQMHLLDPRQCKPYIEPETKALFYGVGGNDMIEDERGDLQALIPARDILHIRLYTPKHPLRGVSPISYAIASIAANNAMTTHQATFFNNMARPSGVITTDQVLNRDQLSSLREAWKAQSTGISSGEMRSASQAEPI